MTTNNPTPHQIALMQLHALACREYITETPAISREELREIVRKCEQQMFELQLFRVAEPCLEGLTRDLVSDAVRDIETPAN